jgi:hypothetical protein
MQNGRLVDRAALRERYGRAPAQRSAARAPRGQGIAGTRTRTGWATDTKGGCGANADGMLWSQMNQTLTVD